MEKKITIPTEVVSLIAISNNHSIICFYLLIVDPSVGLFFRCWLSDANKLSCFSCMFLA